MREGGSTSILSLKPTKLVSNMHCVEAVMRALTAEQSTLISR